MATENGQQASGEPVDAIECSPDAYIIATAIQSVADAIRELAKAYTAETDQLTEEAQPQFDMAGNPIA